MELKDIDLNKLLIFTTVAKNQGYKGASEDLSLTRSAISQTITNLEESLGKKLFYRVGARLQLTEAAQIFYQELSAHQHLLHSTISNFTQKSSKVDGQLRIGAYLEFAKSALMPVIAEYMSAFPTVQVKFTFDSPSRIQLLLENEKLDLAISIFPHKKSNSIESKKLFQEELVLVSRTDLLPRHPDRLQLTKVPIIDYYPSHILFKRWWHNQFNQHLKNTNIAAFAATAEIVYEMVRRRLGVGVVPRYVLDHLPLDSKVHIVQPTENRLFDYVWLSQFRQTDRTPAHSEFLNLLARRFKN